MKKVAAIAIAGFLVILQGCIMTEGKLVREVLSSVDKSKGFEPQTIDDIARKYVPEGTTRAKAKELLLAGGLRDFHELDYKEMPKCANGKCYGLLAWYDHRPPLSPYSNYVIAVNVSFQDGTATTVRGWYSQGCVMPGDIVRHVKQIRTLNRKAHIDISETIQEYIPVGSKKETAYSHLTANKFSLYYEPIVGERNLERFYVKEIGLNPTDKSQLLTAHYKILCGVLSYDEIRIIIFFEDGIAKKVIGKLFFHSL